LRCVDLYKPSAQEVPREDNGDFQMQVIGSVFSGAGKDGDFDWMITEDHYEDALFVFNDNEAQYKAHRDRPTDLAGAGCAPGGGNAIIRPYQCKTPPRAAGIPTGPNYDSLTPEVKQIIDEAIATIKSIAVREPYKRIIYSAANPNGDLGTSIFHVGNDVNEYIVSRLKSLDTLDQSNAINSPRPA
jgi:hypothetical protein